MSQLTWDESGRAYLQGNCTRAACELNPCNGSCKVRIPEADKTAPQEKSATQPAGTDPEDCDAYCPNCGGSGDVEVPEDAGPDSRLVSVCCSHCNGKGTLYGAYLGVLALLNASERRYLNEVAKVYALNLAEREGFLAGRYSHKTGCQPMNTDDEAWDDYLRAHKIGGEA